MRIGDRTIIRPCPYDVVLNRAHARTFHLQKRIQDSKPELKQDEEMKDVLEEKVLDFDIGNPPKVQ
jgi:hypothetical protein